MLFVSQKWSLKHFMQAKNKNLLVLHELKLHNVEVLNTHFISIMLWGVYLICFRYWSHVVNCSSCRVAYKGLNVLEIVLQVISIALIGIVAAAKQGILSAAARNTLVSVALLCFVGSRWLSHFVYKNFHYHDYNHALRWDFVFHLQR